MKEKGFTIIEIIIVMAILGILATISIADFALLQKKSALDIGLQEFTGVLKLAQNKTLSSESDSKYGVYLDVSVFPNKYTLFKGNSYATRISSFDQFYWLPKTDEFYGISLGGGSEIVFDKLTGASNQSGSVSLRVKVNPSQNKTVYLSSSGATSFNLPVSPSDSNRIKDSRHVHFDYSRVIDTVDENIILTFDNSVTRIIPISAYSSGGQIEWQETVNVGGVDQTVEVHTHRLNSTDTQFSIHRDMRLNSKTLKITISGDNSGSLAEYSADGLTTTHPSIYVSNFNWQ